MVDEGKTLIVAADVGGTKTDVGLFEASERPRLVRKGRYQSAAHGGLEEVLDDFLAGVKVGAAGIAAAGPVRDAAIRTTNLPWLISAAQLAERLGGVPACLLNDLEAAAVGVLNLADESFDTLNPGVAQVDRNRAVLGPGTGLGQAILFWNGREYLPSATEGGHVGFAPRSDEQIELLRFMRRRYAHVSYERLVSGMGMGDIFAFVSTVLEVPVAAEVAERLGREDAGPVIGDFAVSRKCLASVRTVEIFFSVLAARAGDLALSVMATGGVYITGGIVPKLLPALDRARFRSDFAGAGPFAEMLAEVPVRLVLEPEVALLGAADVASKRVREAR